MMDSIVAFATTGSPATDAVAVAWSVDDQRMMEFQEKAEMVSLNPEGIQWLINNPIPAAPAVPAPGRIDGIGPRD